MKPGIYQGMSNRDYHADSALGSTSLKTLSLRTPAHYMHETLNPVHKDVYDIGTVTHSLILEGDTSGIKVIDVPDKLGNKWKLPKEAAQAEGLIPLTTAEWKNIQAMRDAVMEHPTASKLLTGHKAEQSVFHDDGDGLMVKIRPDAQKPGMLADLKTTTDASPNEFGRTAYGFGYFISAAHYIDTWEAVTGDKLPFVFINVEKTKPNLVSVIELDEESIDFGRQMISRAKRIYKECKQTGVWPGYQNQTTATLPMYAIYQMEDILGVNQETEIVIK